MSWEYPIKGNAMKNSPQLLILLVLAFSFGCVESKYDLPQECLYDDPRLTGIFFMAVKDEEPVKAKIVKGFSRGHYLSIFHDRETGEYALIPFRVFKVGNSVFISTRWLSGKIVGFNGAYTEETLKNGHFEFHRVYFQGKQIVLRRLNAQWFKRHPHALPKTKINDGFVTSVEINASPKQLETFFKEYGGLEELYEKESEIIWHKT